MIALPAHAPAAVNTAQLVSQVGLPVIMALGFGFARAVGVTAILPVFTRLQLGKTLRVAIAVVIAAIVMQPLAAQFAALGAMPPPATLLIMLIKEGLLGLLLGVIMGVPFWAAETAGEFIDQQRGSQGAIMPSGNQSERAGILGTLMILMCIMVFLQNGGMDFVLRGYIASYRVWPAFALWPSFTLQAAFGVLHLLDHVTRVGLLLAAPLVMAMLIAELSLGLLNRFAQQLNVFDLALSVKSLIVGVGLCLYILVLLGDFHRMIPETMHLAPRLRVLTGN